MADLQDDEHKPLKQSHAHVSHIGTQSASDEEEEKNVLLPRKESGDTDSQDAHVQRDVAHSAFLLGRIAIFLYAFVSVLLSSNFPEESESSIHAPAVGWFKFYIVLNILACVIGMSGVYLNSPKYVWGCWVLLIVSIVLIGLTLFGYIVDEGTGVNVEARNRCDEWIKDDTFSDAYTPEQCFSNMRTQLIWTVTGLYFIYVLAGSFGIHIIKHTEQQMRAYLAKQHRAEQQEEMSVYSADAFSLPSQDQLPYDIDHDQYHPLTDDLDQGNDYDIHLEEVEQKKHK